MASTEDSGTASIGNVLLVIAGIQLAGGLLYLITGAVRRRGCVRLEGTVVDHEVYESGEDGTYHRPLLEYVTPEGERRRIKYGLGLPKPLPTDGSERRVVWHDPRNPDRCHADAKMKFLLPKPLVLALPWIVLIAGLALRFGPWR